MKRFERQTSLQEIGIEGQKKLYNAKVLIVGIGGLGSPISLYLAAAGVGKIGIVDADIVSESNLQRQILYNDSHIGKKKVCVAKEQLEAVYPNINIEIYDTLFTKENAFEIAKGSWGADEKFNAKFVKKMLSDNGLETDFTAGELLKVWKGK